MTGSVFINDETLSITNVVKDGSGLFMHAVSGNPKHSSLQGKDAILNVDIERRKQPAITCYSSCIGRCGQYWVRPASRFISRSGKAEICSLILRPLVSKT